MGRLADRFGIVLPIVARRARARRRLSSLPAFATNLWQFALAQGSDRLRRLGDRSGR